MENEQSHDESSNHFCFSSDEIGNLTRECIINRLAVMNRNDQGMYNYERFLPGHDRQQMQSNPMLIVDPDWRASLVKWVSFVHTMHMICICSFICICIYIYLIFVMYIIYFHVFHHADI